MKMVVMTWRAAGTPELVEALTEDAGYAAIIDPQPTLDSHLRAAEAAMLKLGYRRRDYVLIDGTTPTDRCWRFTFVAPDEFTKPDTR
jgi:hypothetical protein